MPHVTIHIPTPLRGFAGGRARIALEAESAAEALRVLVAEDGRLGARLFADDGSLRTYVNLFLDGTQVGSLSDLDEPLREDVDLTIVPSVAGGAPDSPLSAEESHRYHRQIILPEVGPEGQRRLINGRVALVGLGGLGSPAALYLAAAGVGQLTIIDSDHVDVSNLHRQILHDTPSIGEPKVDSALRRLRDLNPLVRVESFNERLSAGNALSLLSGHDVVVDGSDNFPTRYLVNDACVLLGIPFVYGAIFRFEGQASVFGAPTGPCYRCLFREPPPPDLIPSCAEAGVLGVLPGIIGGIQAAETLKLLLGTGEPLAGRLLMVDSLRMEFRELKIRRDKQCPACGEQPTITQLRAIEEVCASEESAAGGILEIDAGELKARLDSGAPVNLLDIRERHEWDISNFGEYGAQIIPLGELFDRLDELRSDGELIVYCRTGRRSAHTVELLHEAGLTHAVNLRGGINGWSDDIDPTVQKY